MMQNGNIEFRSKGKEFNEISNIANGNYEKWLEVSGITEEELKIILRDKELKIKINNGQSTVQIFLFAGSNLVGEPFAFLKTIGLSNEEAEGMEKNFYADVAVILMLIASKSGDAKVYEKMRLEVKEKIMKNIDK